jgi:hypothetical protein
MATIDELIRKLKSDDANERTLAAYKLGARRTICATEPLIDALQKDPSPNVRTAAAGALGEIGDRRAVETILSNATPSTHSASAFTSTPTSFSNSPRTLDIASDGLPKNGNETTSRNISVTNHPFDSRFGVGWILQDKYLGELQNELCE